MSILSKVRPSGSYQRCSTASLSITIPCEVQRHKISSPAIKKNIPSPPNIVTFKPRTRWAWRVARTEEDENGVQDYKYLIRQTAQSITIVCHFGPCSVFRSLQGHHQGGVYKDKQTQQIMSEIHAYSWQNFLYLYVFVYPSLMMTL